MRTVSYPSDLTGFQWSLIKPHLPVYPGGRPRKTDLRDVVDAIFYILRTGCQWRYLPKDFPPKSTVWRYFNQWRHNGTLETIHDLLRRKVRAAEKLLAPDLGERRQPVGRHHLRRRAAGPGQRPERRRQETPYRRGQHGLTDGRPGDRGQYR